MTGIPPTPNPAGHALSTADPSDVRALYQEFLTAIEYELAATSETDQREAIILPAGSCLHSELGGESLYDFLLPRALPQKLRHGPHLLRTGGKVLQVRLHWHQGRRLVLSVFAHPGEQIPAGATLWTDTRWMCEGILERLTECSLAFMSNQGIEPPFHLTSALQVLGLLAPVRTNEALAPIPTSVLDGLNPEQIDAIRRALSYSACHLWGPPGTGKTMTVAALCEGLYRQGNSVLLATPSNASLDIVLNRVCRRLEKESGFGDGLVIRLGNECTEHLSPDYQEAISYQRVLARQTRVLRESVEALRKEQETIRTESSADSPTPTPSSFNPAAIAISQLEVEISRIHTAIHELPWSLLRQAQVVAGTMHAAILTRRLRRDFDAVVMDEVTMAATPTIFAVAGLARTRVVVAGDFMQLPAPVSTSHPSSLVTLQQDVFRRAGLANIGVNRPNGHDGMAILRTQYRMRPPICEVLNQAFYGGLLRTDHSRLAGRESDSAVVLVDTTDLKPRVYRARGSRENFVHAAVVVRVVERLTARWATLGRPDPNLRIITPYRAQARTIRARLAHTCPDAIVTVATCHASQGSETDIVIIDLTDTAGLPPNGFILGESVHSVGPRLFNVAASRARDHLVIIADRSFIHAHAGGAMRMLIGRVGEVGRIVTGQWLMGKSERREG